MEHSTEQKDYILSVLAQNHSGVLLRIAGLFSRRCYNIKSIVAAQTADEKYSEMIIVVQGNDREVRQVDKQLSKLVEIERVTILEPEKAVVREHLLLQVRRTKENSEALISIANVFHANILHIASDSMILELTGDATTLDGFADLFQPYGVLKILRTGAMAMEKGISLTQRVGNFDADIR